MTLASFKQPGNIPVSKDLLMQSANTENWKLNFLNIFVGISPPTCFTSFTETCWNQSLIVILKFCLIVLMLGWLTNLTKILSISSLLAHDWGTLEERSVHICRFSDSTMDPYYSYNTYSLNVLATNLFFKIISHFSLNITSASTLLCLLEK